MVSNVLIPVDDSPTTQRTIERIIETKERFPRQLSLLHVVNEQLAYRMIPDFQVDMVRANAKKAGQQHLDRIAAQLSEAGFETELLLEFGEPRKTIPQIANEQGFELLVIGRHEGGGEIRDVLFGSVANHILHHVRCPVLLF